MRRKRLYFTSFISIKIVPRCQLNRIWAQGRFSVCGLFAGQLSVWPKYTFHPSTSLNTHLQGSLSNIFSTNAMSQTRKGSGDHFVPNKNVTTLLDFFFWGGDHLHRRGNVQTAIVRNKADSKINSRSQHYLQVFSSIRQLLASGY